MSQSFAELSNAFATAEQATLELAVLAQSIERYADPGTRAMLIPVSTSVGEFRDRTFLN